MSEFHPQYVIDSKGRRKKVILSVREYNELIERAQDALDAAEIERLRGEENFSWSQVKAERAARRKK